MAATPVGSAGQPRPAMTIAGGVGAARSGLRQRRSIAVVVIGALLVSVFGPSVAPPPARAGIFNVIPMNELEEPTDFFTTANALLAYVTADIFSGDVCVVAATVENPGDGSLECPGAWHTANTISPGFAGITLLEPPGSLQVGEWKLLGDGFFNDALSIPFTVVPCEADCSTEVAQSIVEDFKAHAGEVEEAAGFMCKAAELVSVARKLNAARKIVGNFSAAGTLDGQHISVLKFGLSALGIPTSALSFYLLVLKLATCRAEKAMADIRADPPDFDYGDVAEPIFVPLPVSGKESADVVATRFDRIDAYAGAVLHALERYQGASLDGELEYVRLQASALGDFAEQLALELEQVAPELRAFGPEVAAEPDLNDPVVTQAELEHVVSVRGRVASTGFTEEETQELLDLGLTAAEIEEFRQGFVEDVSDAPVDTSFPTIVEGLAVATEDASAAFHRLARSATNIALHANAIPVASFTTSTAAGRVPLTVTFTDSSTDLDGHSLTVTWDFGDGASGTGSPLSHTYTAAGTYTATLTVTDGFASSSATAEIVATENEPPSAADDSLTTAANTPATINVLANDSDPDFDPLAVSSSADPLHGEASCSTAGSCTYTPTGGFDGDDTFEYTVTDGAGGTATATVFVTVSPASEGNRSPIAVDDSLTVTVNKSGSIRVLDNDSDPDGDSLALATNGGPAHGSVECLPWGICEYTPTTDYVGPDSFDYTVADGHGGIDVGTVAVTVQPNRPPIAVNDELTTRRNAPSVRLVAVLTNDSDPDGDSLTIASNTEALHGVAVCSLGGQCSYSPEADYVGSDSFEYTADDGAGGRDTATVTITVTENNSPVAVDDEAATIKDQPITVGVLTNDDDPDGDSIVIAARGVPGHGTADCSESTCTYTPDGGYVGPDTFEYTVSDGELTDIGTVAITVHPPCFPAVCIDNGTVLLAVLQEGHLNALDGTGSPAGQGPVGLHFIPTGNEATAPGCLCEGWGAADADSEVTGFANVSTDQGARNMTVESFTWTPSTAISIVNIQDTLRVTHDYHPSADTLNLYEVTVTIENISSGSLADVRYRRVMDWDVEPTPFSEFVTIDGGNATNLLFDSNNGFASANPLAGASDIGGHTGDFTDIGPFDHGALFDFGFGTLAAGEETTFNIFYGAAATETDAESSVAASGAEVYSFGQSNMPDGPTLGTPNTFIFAFGGVGGDPIFAPDALDDTLTTAEDSAGSRNVLTNDTDPDGDILGVTASTNGTHGTVTCLAAGTCTYTPELNFHGSDSFTYTISDGNGGTDTATVNVTVTPVNDPPAAGDEAFSTAEDSPGTRNVLTNDIDVDGDALTVISSTNGANGTVGCTLAGSCTYTPAANFHGSDSFTYTISDGNGGSDTATVNVTVTPVNDPPAALDDALTTSEDSGGTLNVLTNDSDVDGNTLTVSTVSDGAHGTVVCTAAGSCTYTPAAAFSGSDSFTYTASDGNGGSAIATVNVTVTPHVTGPECNGLEATIVGGLGADYIQGTGGVDVIFDPGGHNYIQTGTGDDHICLGDGNDEVDSGDGNDFVSAGNGTNKVKTGSGSDTVRSGLGNDEIDTGDASDEVSDSGGRNKVLTGNGSDTVMTGSGNDDIDTGTGADVVADSGGTNTVTTGDGNDTIRTGAGNDRIDGGNGFDTCNAGAGSNRITKCELISAA